MKPSAHPLLRATRLLDQVHEQFHYKHYSVRNEQAFAEWGTRVCEMARFAAFAKHRAVGDRGFLAIFANERRVAAATHICKPVSMHTLRYSFAMHLLQSGTYFSQCRSCWALGRKHDSDLYPSSDSRCRQSLQSIGILGVEHAA